MGEINLTGTLWQVMGEINLTGTLWQVMGETEPNHLTDSLSLLPMAPAKVTTYPPSIMLFSLRACRTQQLLNIKGGENPHLISIMDMTEDLSRLEKITCRLNWATSKRPLFGSDRSPRCQDVCMCVCVTFFKREL